MDVLLNFIFSSVGADSFVLPEEKRKKFRFSSKGAAGKEARRVNAEETSPFEMVPQRLSQNITLSRYRYPKASPCGRGGRRSLAEREYAFGRSEVPPLPV